MRCTVCGAELTATRTDLPFKVSETSIVILKNLPVPRAGLRREQLAQGGLRSLDAAGEDRF